MWRVLRRYGSCVLLSSSLAIACGESTRSSIDPAVGGAGGSAGVLGVAGTISLGGGESFGGMVTNNFACPLEVAPLAPVTRLSVVDIDGALTALFGDGPTLASRVTWRETGYVRVINSAFVSALRDVAVARAEATVGDDDSFEICEGEPAKAGTCAEDFVRDWGGRIYRRPLENEQVSAYVAQFRAVLRDGGGAAAARNALVSMLLSPYFALRLEFGEGNYSLNLSLPELAARISHFAARTTPDDALRASVESGALADPNEALAQYKRLVATPRGEQARATLVLEWFGIDKVVPQASPPIEQQADMIARAAQLAQSSFEPGKITLDALLTTPRAPDLAPELAAGMLASEAFLARYPRPTARGIQIQLALMGVRAPDSPPGVSEVLGNGDTPRDRIQGAIQFQAECDSCHKLFDPIGFALDAFDDRGQPTGFDSSGYVGVNGTALPVQNPAELGRTLASSEPARNTAARRYLELALDRRLDDDPGSGYQDVMHSDPPQGTGGQSGGGQGGSFGVPPIPNIPTDPDTSWLRCLQHSTPVNQPLDLDQIGSSIVLSDGFRRRAQPPRALLVVDVSADPVEHAFQEAATLTGAFLATPDNDPLNMYRLALLAVVQSDALQGAGGASSADNGGGGAAGATSASQGGAP
jgi:hypothetical protein